MKIKNPGFLKDALHNGSVQCTRSDDNYIFQDRKRSQLYALGIFHGVVSTIMAMGYLFDEALREAVKYLPEDFDITMIHDSWLIALRGTQHPVENLDVFQKGVYAQQHGAPLSDNPYPPQPKGPHPSRRESWIAGYLAAEEKERKEKQ